MQAYMCSVCGYLYDEQSADKNIEGNLIDFLDLDPDWICPICGVKAELFERVNSDRVPDISQDEK